MQFDSTTSPWRATIPASYDAMIASSEWTEDLRSLNAALAEALRAADCEPILCGNLFYLHRQADFETAPLEPDFDHKRRRFFEIARQGGTMIEIGVNGGHSLLLAKSANPALRLIGIDICRSRGEGSPRGDIYVPVAMRWLETRFPGDFRFRVGDSRVEAPRFAIENPDERIDILHVDGAKATYLCDIVNLLPVLHEGTILVIDDSELPEVRKYIRALTRAGIAEPHPKFRGGRLQRYRHAIMRISERYLQERASERVGTLLKRSARRVLPVERIRRFLARSRL